MRKGGRKTEEGERERERERARPFVIRRRRARRPRPLLRLAGKSVRLPVLGFLLLLFHLLRFTVPSQLLAGKAGVSSSAAEYNRTECQVLYIPTRKIYLVDNNDDACAAPRSEAKICTTSVPRGPTPLCKIKCGRKETLERKGKN